MGHDEDKNFNGGTSPINNQSYNPVQDELNRISGVMPQTQTSGGDIILNNSSAKKNNKIVIIIVAVVILIIGIVVAAVVFTNSKKGNASDVKSASTAKVAFNNFYHYLADKTDSDADILEEDFNVASYLEKNPNENNLKYLSVLEEKYQAFISEYGKTSGKIIPEDIYPYYYGYFRTVLGASQINIVKVYKEEGLEGTHKYIYDAVKPFGDAAKTNTELDEYIRLRREELILRSNLVPYIEAAGCINSDFTVKESCSYVRDENSARIESQISEYMNVRQEKTNTMKARAHYQIKSLYNEIYENQTMKSGEAK